jgi:hypothetical protein
VGPGDRQLAVEPARRQLLVGSIEVSALDQGFYQERD